MFRTSRHLFAGETSSASKGMEIEPLTSLTPLLPADIGDALALVAEAGWNQVANDWRIMLACGEGSCVRDSWGRAIATSVALPYPEGGFGWVGMVLVHGPFRKRGLATTLLGGAIDALRAKGRVPMLDATPAGRAVYEPMGFRPIEQISRWRGDGAASAVPRRVPPSTDAIAAFVEADGAAFGAPRPRLIADLLRRPDSPMALRAEGAFLLTRAGRTATQIGPLVARDEASAANLLTTAIDALSGPVLLDMPDTERDLASLVAARGFRVERIFTRMAPTDGPLVTRRQTMRIIAGPELG
jgi:GNAT superfamily N-acetyltransferase